MLLLRKDKNIILSERNESMIKIIFDKSKSIAYDEEKQIGMCEFREDGNYWNITHTEVDSSYQGQGIAKRLVECVIENARMSNKKIIADCSYAKKVIEREK